MAKNSWGKVLNKNEISGLEFLYSHAKSYKKSQIQENEFDTENFEDDNGFEDIESEPIDYNNNCMICSFASKDCAYIPCGCLLNCFTCANDLKNNGILTSCQFCGKQIDSILKLNL